MKKRNYPLFSFFIFSIAFILFSSMLVTFFSEIAPKKSTYTFSKASPPLVIIDAGHGGEDCGAIGKNGCFEKDINLSMSKKLSSILSGIGIKNILTRNSDILLYDKNSDYIGQKKHLDMQERLKIVNSYQNVIFVSVHQNAFPEEKYSGFQIYFSPNSQSSQIIAQKLEEAVRLQIQPSNKRKAKSSAGNIYLLDRLECPAVLLECGFLSNPNECELLCSEEYQNRMCAVIASCLENFIAAQS